MPFPDIRSFKPESGEPGPYEIQMGRQIASVLSVFTAHVPDAQSHAHVSELVATPKHWSAAHAVFDEVRSRFLTCQHTGRGDSARAWQYLFEEACCQAVYNATAPDDPFDESAPFFVIPSAIYLAEHLGLSLALVSTALRTAENTDRRSR